MDKHKNVFISHYGKDNEKISDLKELLSQKGYYLKDSSISSEDNNASSENYIKNKLLIPKINWAGQMIVLIGDKTHKRDFVNWEIEQAHRRGMNITGVYLYGGKQDDYSLPENFEKYGTSLTGWNTNNIINSLEDNFNEFRAPDNQVRLPSSNFSRGIC